MIFAIKKLLPSFVLKLFRLFLLKKENVEVWSGNYKSWEDAKAECTGYNDELILEKCKESLLKVKNGDAVYERDSVLFDKIQYSWGLLAGLQKVAIENKGKLSVIDFGGSLGSTYYQNINFLSTTDVSWSIIEQENFVKCGIENFQDNQLKFYYSIVDCLKVESPNVIVLSSVLQYLDKPCEWIDKFLLVGTPYIILDRTSFIESESELLTIQNVPSSIYKASYPAWFFNKKKLIERFVGYELLAEFDNHFTNDYKVNGHRTYWRGIIFKKLK